MKLRFARFNDWFTGYDAGEITGGDREHEGPRDDKVGERFRGGIREGQSEHQPGVQGATDPGQAQVQSESGPAAPPSTIPAAPAAEFTQQQYSRALAGPAAASAADSRALRVQEELLHPVVRRQAARISSDRLRARVDRRRISHAGVSQV